MASSRADRTPKMDRSSCGSSRCESVSTLRARASFGAGQPSRSVKETQIDPLGRYLRWRPQTSQCEGSTNSAKRARSANTRRGGDPSLILSESRRLARVVANRRGQDSCDLRLGRCLVTRLPEKVAARQVDARQRRTAVMMVLAPILREKSPCVKQNPAKTPSTWNLELQLTLAAARYS
jgi:hypothetical protein